MRTSEGAVSATEGDMDAVLDVRVSVDRSFDRRTSDSARRNTCDQEPDRAQRHRAWSHTVATRPGFLGAVADDAWARGFLGCGRLTSNWARTATAAASRERCCGSWASTLATDCRAHRLLGADACRWRIRANGVSCNGVARLLESLPRDSCKALVNIHCFRKPPH